MTANSRTDDRDGATNVEFCLPAGGTPPVDTRWLGDLWDDLFNHGVEPPK